MRRTRLALLALSAAGASAGCAATDKVVLPTPLPIASAPTVIQQMGYGSAAQFNRCERTTCPNRTVKTSAHVERGL